MLQRVGSFDDWRSLARYYLLTNTDPSAVVWQAAEDTQQFLFDSPASAVPAASGKVTLPKQFVETAKIVARHRDAGRWALLYRVAWRIQNGERHLLKIGTDDDVHALCVMKKAVDLDIYKMQAFVRFRRVVHEEGEQYVAWYRPDHHTLDANERFFAERFAGMRWAILTPEISMAWDLNQVLYGPGVPRTEAPAEDAYEDLWRAYYSSIYNPARLNLDAMRAQLPMRRWVDLPESRAIPELVRTSKGSVEAMRQMQPVSASAFIPVNATLSQLRESVRACNACELCGRATQPVFGEGGPGSRLMIVGEQPGDEEDLAGHPFVGPAGQLLNLALAQAGLDRSSLYLTNAVKAFRFEERGKRRIHQSPRSSHIATCRPWLDAEIERVRPSAIVCLGATAAQSVLGRAVKIQDTRGMRETHRSGVEVIVTYHPAAVLRAFDDSAKTSLQKALVDDLIRAVSVSALS